MKIKMQNVILDTIDDLNYVPYDDYTREERFYKFLGQLDMYREVTGEYAIYRTSDAGVITSIKFGNTAYITCRKEGII